MVTINHEKNTSNNNSVAHIFKFSKIKMRCHARAVKWVSDIRTRTDLSNWGSIISDGCLSQYWVVNELSAQSWEPWLAALWNGDWSHSGNSEEIDHLPWDRRITCEKLEPLHHTCRCGLWIRGIRIPIPKKTCSTGSGQWNPQGTIKSLLKIIPMGMPLYPRIQKPPLGNSTFWNCKYKLQEEIRVHRFFFFFFSKMYTNPPPPNNRITKNYLFSCVTSGFRCGILSRKSLCAISGDIEVDCFALCGPRWIQIASTQGQMISVCINGSLPCRNTPDLLKVSQNLEPIRACLIPFFLH